MRPSGRCSARRRSTSAACSSAAIRWRASGVSSAEDENTSWTPNRRWITPSCTSRARSMRSCSCRARAPAGGRDARERGERGGLAERPQQVALLVGERPGLARVRQDHAEPAPRGRERRADEVGLAHAARGTPPGPRRRCRRVDLDDAVLLQRLARDGRGLDGDLRVRERVDVDPVGARGAHAPARPRRSGRSPRGPSRSARRSPRRAGCRRRRRTRRPRPATAARRTCRARRCARPGRLRPSSCGSTPSILPAHLAVHRNPGRATR